MWLGLAVLSCFEPPEFPLEPQIDFKSVRFRDMADPNTDSLVVEVFFKDGDGNLGLDPAEIGCYDAGDKQICHQREFELFVTEGPNTGKPINYAMKRTDPSFKSYPAYVRPYSCTHWKLAYNKDDQVIDTVAIELNPDHYNIFVDFLVKQADGSFKEFDFMTEFCQTYDGRFPILSKDPSQKNTLEGVIRYGMPSQGFKSLFSIKTLKLRIQVQDRLLNKSNIVESPEFTLQSITN
ncbi:MAG: hypothetical protein ACOYW3_13225 [Bacteroidota bacterium]